MSDLVSLTSGADRLLVRADVPEIQALLPRFLDGITPPGARALAGGRGAAVSVPLGSGGRAVLRRNLRGGLPARFIRDLYFGWRPRPFAEVAALERLRAAGLRVPDALGAIARAAGPGVYRGAVATREVAGSANGWEYLRAAEALPARRRVCAGIVALVDEMLAAGAVHPDLNLTNFLVVAAAGEEAPVIWLVDCDRVRFGATGPAHRERALARLRRSARKLDPAGEVVDPAWLA